MTFHPIHGAEQPAPAAGAHPTPGVPPARPEGAHQPTDTVQLSAAAALMRRLDALAQESPARFLVVMARVASRLTAQAAVEPRHALALGQLAERFAAAAQTGTPAPLVAASLVAAGAEGPRPIPFGPGAPSAAGTAQATAAALADAALVAGAASQREPVRPRRRSPYRPGPASAPPADQEAGAAAGGGGILGALLGAVTGVVEAAIDAVLLEVPAEGEEKAPGR